MKKPTLSITIDNYVLTEIKKRAKSKGLSVSEFIQDLIEKDFYEEYTEKKVDNLALIFEEQFKTHREKLNEELNKWLKLNRNQMVENSVEFAAKYHEILKKNGHLK